MKTLNIEIFDHDSEVEVAHKINTMELHNWMSHLTYIHKELNNLLEFYRSQTVEKRIELEKIYEAFEIKQVDNGVILRHLLEFKESRNKVSECEDMQCDMSFIQEHEKCRRMYLYHIEKYRKIKDLFFKELQGKTTSKLITG